jgi:hypothetical protein
VGGAAAKNIAAVSTSTGALVAGFKDNAGGQVETILAVNGHLLTGGFFKGISGSTADPYYASLSPATGKNDGFLHLSISGHIQFPGVKNNATEVYNQQLSHGGTLVLVEGDFTSVGVLNRRQRQRLQQGRPRRHPGQRAGRPDPRADRRVADPRLGRHGRPVQPVTRARRR